MLQEEQRKEQEARDKAAQEEAAARDQAAQEEAAVALVEFQKNVAVMAFESCCVATQTEVSNEDIDYTWISHVRLLGHSPTLGSWLGAACVCVCVCVCVWYVLPRPTMLCIA